MKKIGYLIGGLITLAIIAGYLKFYLPLKQVEQGAGKIDKAEWELAAIISVLVAIYLTRNYLKNRIEPQKWLVSFVWCRAVFFIGVALAFPVYLLTRNTTASGICLLVFWLFVFLSFMTMPAFTCSFWFPELKKYIWG